MTSDHLVPKPCLICGEQVWWPIDASEKPQCNSCKYAGLGEATMDAFNQARERLSKLDPRIEHIEFLKTALLGFLTEHGWEGPTCECDLCFNAKEAIKKAGGLPNVTKPCSR